MLPARDIENENCWRTATSSAILLYTGGRQLRLCIRNVTVSLAVNWSKKIFCRENVMKKVKKMLQLVMKKCTFVKF